MLARRPELPAHLAGPWQAFCALSRGRPHGMAGPLPIAFEAIDRYAARFGPSDEDDFAELLELLAAMDRAFLEHAGRRRR